MDTSVVVDDILSHHGVLGMKWGQRNASSSGPRAVTVTDKGRRLKTSGGQGHPAHPDAVRAHTIGQKAKKSGLKSLSDQELQDYSRRLNLEQNVNRLRSSGDGKKFAEALLKEVGNQDMSKVIESVKRKS